MARLIVIILYCESPRNRATLFPRSFQTSYYRFMKGFQFMKKITKCLSFFKAILLPSINLLENFPIGNVVNYLYCNDLFMFSIQDFLHGHKPLSHILSKRYYISLHNNWGFSYKCEIRKIRHFSMTKSYH